jgi:tetratricopeptide (TPR) repeat protein
MNDPYELVLAHRYEEALAAYDAGLSPGKGRTAPDVANRATVLLLLGRLPEALAEYRRANQLMSRLDPAAYFNEIGTVLWLMGKREEAMDIWRTEIDDTLNGTASYGDFAGGVSQGLLLWYGGVTMRDAAMQQYAKGYLHNRCTRIEISRYPGPIAKFALGRIPFEDVLDAATGTRTLHDAVNRAKRDLLKRRELVQAIFYLATSKREAADEHGCIETMALCASLENPTVENEWYLARHEAEQHQKCHAGK